MNIQTINNQVFLYLKILPAGFNFNFCGIVITGNSEIGEIEANHEKIHTKQMYETLFVGYWILSVIFWIWNILNGYPISCAWKFTPFEQEAISNDDYIIYCETRKPFAWFDYFV